MKSVVILVILAAGGGILLAKGLDTKVLTSKTLSMPDIEPQSVAYHCSKAIQQVWQNARESSQDLDGLKGQLAFVAFDYVATQYCVCNQGRFGEMHSDGEKALYGKLAGLNLKMEFSHHFSKSLRKKLSKEAQSIAKSHQSLITTKPSWLGDINDNFRACKREQSFTTNFSSYGSR